MENAKAYVDHGNYKEPLNLVKENAPVQRCWPTLPTHEQGCFSHVFNAYGKKFSVHVKIVKSQEMHSFRLMETKSTTTLAGGLNYPVFALLL